MTGTFRCITYITHKYVNTFLHLKLYLWNIVSLTGVYSFMNFILFFLSDAENIDMTWDDQLFY